MKLLKIMVAALLLAAMVAPAIAEDRLSLSGEMRVRGWYADFDYDDDNNDSTRTWADQRLRVGGKIAVAEGVSITFRTDITESNWGTTGGGNGFGSGRSGAAQQWDRAHIDLTKGNFHVRAGQQYVAYGKTYAIDSQDNGVAMDYNFDSAKVNAFVLLDNCNESNCAAGDQTDAFLYGGKVSSKMSDIAFEIFGGGFNDGADESVGLIGADMTAALGGVNLMAELDYFFGDANADDDAYGTQFMFDASMALTPAFTLGGQFYYGLGDDKDVQYTGLGNGFGGWDPVYDVGTSLSNEQMVFGNPFNVASFSDYESQNTAQFASAGSIGGRLYAGYKANDVLSFGASAGYFTSEEDKQVDVDVVALAAGVVYKVMANTTLQLQVQYADGTLNETDFIGTNDDIDFDAFRAGTGLFVAF